MADKQLKLTLHLSTEKAVGEIRKLQEKYERLVQEMKTAEPGTEAFEQLTMEVTTARAALEAFGATTQDKMAKSLEQGAKKVKGVNDVLKNTAKVIKGLPAGMNGVTDSIGPLVESFISLKKQTGSAKTAMMALVSGLTGPGGIAIAVSAVATLVTMFGDDLVRAISGTNDELDETLRRVKNVEEYTPIEDIITLNNLKGIERAKQEVEFLREKVELMLDELGAENLPRYTVFDSLKRQAKNMWTEISGKMPGFIMKTVKTAFPPLIAPIELFGVVKNQMEKVIEPPDDLQEKWKEAQKTLSDALDGSTVSLESLEEAFRTLYSTMSAEDVEKKAELYHRLSKAVRNVKEAQNDLTNKIEEQTGQTTLKKTMDEWLDQSAFKQRLDNIYNDSVTVFENMKNKLGFDPYEKQKEFIDQYIEKQLKLREGLEMTSEEMVRLLNQADVAAEENATKQVDNNDKITQSEDAKKEAAMNSAIQSGLAAGEQAKGVQDMAKVSAQAARQQLSSAFSEVVSEAINSTMKAFPAPFNIALAAAAAAAAKALFNSVVPKFAGGGYVTGPGTATSDSIPALLSNGEYVVNAATTAAAPGLLGAMNRSPSLL